MKLKATHAEKLQYGFIFHVAFAILVKIYRDYKLK